MSETLFAGETDQVASELEKVKQQFTKEDGSVDVDGLLNSKAHANLHVKKVESEAANLRTEVDKRLAYEDLLSKITAQREAASSNHQNNDNVNEQTPRVVTAEDIRAAARDEISKIQQEATVAANLGYVQTELEKLWGADWVNRLKTFAKEKHQREEDLDRMAKLNPRGLLALVNSVPVQRADNTYVPPQTRQNTTASKGSEQRNWNFYKKMMHEDPRKFKSVEVQNLMHEDAHAMGPDFYN